MLARAHRDGGHYIDEHGLGKAVEVAHERIADAYMERDALRAEVKALEDAAHRSRCDLLDAQTEVDRLKHANASLIPGGMMVATEIECLRVERDNAMAIARVLAHSYTHDSRPPQYMVDEALKFPVKP